jgi:hypothetical protein
MIQQEYKNNVQQVSGNVETTGFSIEVNESMFQMLTSNVYNDPTLAVMREWSTNACDACIAAGKDIVFDVHLPTLEEPFFSVRDYGTGLCPEDIKGLFSNLGASTKRNSNAYNGTLGIGRMAGLAVSDAFTVDSYYQGTHYSYAISMQNGVPVTMSLGSTPTSEPNGLKLSVSVEHDDIQSYRERAESLYKFFDHKPNLNLTDICIDLDVSEHISDSWFIIKEWGRGYRDSNYVVMSQVAYEIPYSREVETQGFRNLVIKAEPGSVTFNPGRESLSLNKNTVDYLNKRFEEIAQEYVEAADDKLSECTTDFEVMQTYANVTRACPSSLVSSIDPAQYASDYFKALFSTGRWYHSNTSVATFDTLAIGTNFKTKSNDLLTILYKTSYHKNSKTMDENLNTSWKEFFFSKHVIIDLKSKFRSALNEHFSSQSLISWQRAQGADFDEAVAKAKEYLDAMGIPYQLASNIVAQEDFTLTTSAAPREGFYASKLDAYDVLKSEKMEDWETTSKSYLYLKLKNTTPVLSDEAYSFEEYVTAYKLLSKATDMPEIRGVAKKYQDYADSLDNWHDFESYIKTKMAEATFKVPVEVAPPTISHRAINESTKHLYPQLIQDFYNELSLYKEFISNSDYVEYENEKTLVARMGASFVTYEPSKEIDMEVLETMYPKSMEMMKNRGYYYDINAELVSYVANLEDFYAVHSSQQ